MKRPTFSILITTKDRISELKITLRKINHLIVNKQVECIICDDGSFDETYSFITNYYPYIKLIRNPKSMGLIASRNRLLSETSSLYAISLDDDAHFLIEEPLQIIEDHFNSNPNCGVIACRIFWGLKVSSINSYNLEFSRVKGFVGCGHIWNMKAWRAIPNYPEWFVFYGEEDFASFHLFKKYWEVHYLPNIVIQHRVEVKTRKKNKDYQVRLRRSLRSGWYLYLLFYPLKEIPRRFIYTLWIQLKLKVILGRDAKAAGAILQALLDLVYNFPRILRNSSRLTNQEFVEYCKIPKTEVYGKS